MKKNKMGTFKDFDCRRLEVLKEQNYNTTKELASLLRVEPQTIIRSLCINGNYLGLRPVKLPNNRLLWPCAEAHNLLKK